MQEHNAVLRVLLDVGVARMVEGTELHLLHIILEDDKLTLAGKDYTALVKVLLQHKGIFDYPPLGLQPDLWIKLCLKTGNQLMQQSHPVKQLSVRELIELNSQLHDLY